MVVTRLAHKPAKSPCRDPIYRVCDSSKDATSKRYFIRLNGDKSVDAINRAPTGVGFFLFEWYCDKSVPAGVWDIRLNC
jgi:hypothetical protein